MVVPLPLLLLLLPLRRGDVMHVVGFVAVLPDGTEDNSKPCPFSSWRCVSPLVVVAAAAAVCCAVLCCTVRCDAVLCRAVPCGAVRCGAVR